MIRICASIAEKNRKNCIRAISAAKKLGASLAEIRIDYLDRDEEISKIIHESSLPLIVTNRNKKEGGKFKGSEEERINNLLDAIDAGCGFVDIELNTEGKLREKIIKLAKRNKCKVIASVHDFNKTPDIRILNKFLNEERKIADIGKIVTFGNRIEDTAKNFNLLKTATSVNFPLITFAMGNLCRFSRIAAPLFGSYLTYASIGKPSAAGQFSIKEMVDFYKKIGCGYMISDKTKFFYLIGHPVEHSLSPLMYNKAFEFLKLNFNYRAFDIKPGQLKAFVQKLREENIGGANVTIPYKTEIMEYVDETDETASSIGAINTIVNQEGSLKGYNFDGLAAVKSLEEKCEVKNKKIVLLGAGGAARAICFNLAKKAKEIVVLSRSLERVKKLETDFDVIVKSLEAGNLKKELANADILINCTPVGMWPKIDETLVKRNQLNPKTFVFDIIYNPVETRLLKEAKAVGCKTLNGVEMFINQGVETFELLTGKKAPVELMRKAVIEALRE